MPTFNAPAINGPASVAGGPATEAPLIGSSPANVILVYTSAAVVLGSGFLLVESDRRGSLALTKGIASWAGERGGLFITGGLADPRFLLADAPPGAGEVAVVMPPMWARDP